MGLQLLVHGFRFAGGARKVYSGEYYKRPAVTALLEEHKKATGEDKLPSSGYPDMGNGRYAAALTYSEWFAVNNGQRAHYNGVESIAVALASLLAGGAFFPRVAAGAGAAYIVGRELYATGYAAKGPSGRIAGAGLVDLGLLVLVGTAIVGGLLHTGLIKF